MERPLSQRDAALLERRRQPDRRSLAPHDRLLRPVPPRQPRARAPASTTSPSMTVSRWPTCSATTRSTTRPTAKTIATAPTTTTATIAAMKARPTIAAIIALRRQLRKNQLACLLLAQGTPLMLAGDEVGNSQNGNNNAYCQDNEIGWVDWDNLGKPGDDLTDFVGHMTALRRRFAQLRCQRWLDGRRDGRLLWRAVADAGGRGDEGSRLEFPGRPIPRLCAGAAGTRAAADLYRAERRPRRDRFQIARRCPNTRAGSRC